MRPAIPTVVLSLAVAGCRTGNPHALRYDDGARTATYYPIAGAAAGADLRASVHACDQRLGVAPAWPETSGAYKHCMRAQGWTYGYETRDGTYLDPRHPGLVCHDIVVFGVVGSSCSNR